VQQRHNASRARTTRSAAACTGSGRCGEDATVDIVRSRLWLLLQLADRSYIRVCIYGYIAGGMTGCRMSEEKGCAGICVVS
jgi:hypothetical protein